MRCPECGSTNMRSDTDLRTKIVCWICKSCNTIFTEGNIDEYWAEHSASRLELSGGQKSERCQNCGQSLSGSSLTLPWEDGNNPNAYVKCRYCGYNNTKYGFGEE